MALRGVCHGSWRSPSWLCEQSVMSLGGICHLWILAFDSTGKKQGKKLVKIFNRPGVAGAVLQTPS